MTKSKIDFDSIALGFDEINPNKMKHELVYKKIDIALLDENPNNNNIYDYDKDADDFLKQDIEKNGILNPIIIIKSENHAGRYTIVSGHRRTRIAKELGIYEVDAREIIARTIEEIAYAKVMLITANSTQRDRKPTEIAKEIKYLKDIAKENNIENVAKWISSSVKMSERNVYRYEKLANQSKDIQTAVDEGEMSVKQAIGEVSHKDKAKDDESNIKEVDTYKVAQKVYHLLCDIEDEINREDGFTIKKKTMDYLDKSVLLISGLQKSS